MMYLLHNCSTISFLTIIQTLKLLSLDDAWMNFVLLLRDFVFQNIIMIGGSCWKTVLMMNNGNVACFGA
jgi:hypothetical protein